jgi:hypothetical protein
MQRGALTERQHQEPAAKPTGHMGPAFEQIIKVSECERRQPMQVSSGYAFERIFLHDTIPNLWSAAS